MNSADYTAICPRVNAYFRINTVINKKITQYQLVNSLKLWSNNVSFSVIVSSPAEFQSSLSQSAFEYIALAD